MGSLSADTTYEHIQSQYDTAERVSQKLGRELHLPFLEMKLYTKFFISARDKEHLQATLLIVNTMLEHKRLTLKVLGLIQAREEVLEATKQLAFKYSSRAVSTLDIQSQTFQLLFCLQQTALRVVEGITEWRSVLTRPYPFTYKGENYLLKMIADAQFLDSSELSTVMPLQLTAHPLCSNLTSLSLFGGGVSTAKTGHAIRPSSASYPLKKKYLQNCTEDPGRIQSGETVIYEEIGLQKKLMKELQGISASGSFLPLLNLQAIIPNCVTGVRLTNKTWDHRYNVSLSKAANTLHNTEVVRTAPLDNGLKV